MIKQITEWLRGLMRRQPTPEEIVAAQIERELILINPRLGSVYCEVMAEAEMRAMEDRHDQH